MRTVGIISEYNPFHKGHMKHLSETVKALGDINTIAVMSGNFVQRGEIAMADKYSRAAFAVANGIDICLELPTLFALSNAHEFAMGGVTLLNDLKLIDNISFGVENIDVESINKIASVVANEPADYSSTLKDYLKSGLSFPKARSMALMELFPDLDETVLNTPNNILAIEYISALIQTDSSIKPIMIERAGAGYNSIELDSEYSSATGIRTALKNGIDISTHIPDRALGYMKPYLTENQIINDDLSALLFGYILDNKYNSNRKNIYDMTIEMYNRLNSVSDTTFNMIVEQLKSKNYTETRIKRVLLHFILNIKNKDLTNIQDINYRSYANLLSAKKDKTSILRQISDKAVIPVITKKADYKPASDAVKKLRDIDYLATDLYRHLVNNKLNIHLKPEIISTPIII